MRHGTGVSLSRRSYAVLALVACAAFSFLLTGCGLGTPAAVSGGFGSQSIEGSALGGFGPIGNADVYLYVAGTTGYGLGATQLDHTKTSTDGKSSFSFSPTDYTCPAGGQIYLMLKGGDPNGGSAASNTAISLVASIGTCGSLSSYTVINEASTIATVTAAQQFFNAATESFGSPASTQAQTGLANAFALARAIVPSGSGQPLASYNPTSSVSGSVVTATPETSKLNGMADILAACVDTAVNTSPACTDLFNSAIAPPEASATSGSTATYTAATDTLMAAYYMAVNPILGTMTSVGSSPNVTGTNSSCAAAGNTSVSNMTCLFDLITAQPPFATSLAGPSGTPALLDWTLSVAYSATGNCGVQGSPLNDTWHGAVDASGNVWIITDSVAGAAGTAGSGTAGTYSTLNELGPTGNLMLCTGGTSSAQGGQMAFGRDVAIDTAGNVWVDTNGGNIYPNTSTASPGTGYRNRVDEYIPSTSTMIPQTNFPTSQSAYYMTADGLGNLYVQAETTGGILYEYPGAANLSALTVAPVIVGNNPVVASASTTQSLYGIQADSNNNIWISNQNSATDYVYVQTTSGPAPSGTMTSFSGKGQVSTGPYNLVIDANNEIVIANTCCSSASANKAAKTIQSGSATTPVSTVTAGPVSAQYAGGLTSTRSMAVDGANNLWTGSGIATNGSGYYNVAELDSNLNGLSPTGTPTGTCPGPSCLTNGGYAKSSLGVARGVTIDGSGNVWAFSSTGTQVTQLIGAAVPVVTPMSIATAYNLLGKKPTSLNALSFSLPAETETAGTGYSATIKFGTNSPAPTGTITFTPAGSGTPTCTLSSGTTAFTGTVACSSANSTLAAGTYSVVVTYSGDSNYYATPSGIVATLTVQ